MGRWRSFSGHFWKKLGLVVNKDEADTVKIIYGEFLAGYSYTAIAKKLTALGIKMPAGKSVWNGSTVKSILTNEKYCGDVLYQKSFTPNYITHASKKNSGEFRQWHWTERHKAIIPKLKWLAAQDLLREKMWSSRKIRLRDIPKRFVVSRIKSGRLAGFYLIDPDWDADEREKFLSIIRTIPFSKKSDDSGGLNNERF